MTRLLRLLIQYRLSVVVGTGLLTLFAGAAATRVAFEASAEMWFIEGDPELARYHDFLERFGGDEMLLLAVFAPDGQDVFEPEVLTALRWITERAQDVPGASGAKSLLNTDFHQLFVEDGEEIIESRPLVEDLPTSPAEVEALRRRALGHPLVPGNLVSDDGRVAVVVVEVDNRDPSLQAKMHMVQVLEAIAAHESKGGIEVKIAGTPAFDTGFFRRSEATVRKLVPLAVAIVLLSTWLVFRSPWPALIPLLVVGGSIAGTLGTMAIAGLSLNIISSALYSLILAVGVADSIHVLSDYYQRLMAGDSREEAVTHSVSAAFVPCTFTSLTTCVGLLALTTSDLAPVKEFGAMAALGVFIAYVLSFTLVPAVLIYAKPPSPDYLQRQRTGPISRAVAFLARPSARWRRAVLVAAGPLLVLALALIPRLHVASNPLLFLSENDPVRQATFAIDGAIGGSTSLELVAEMPREGLWNPGTLERIDHLERWLEDLPGVTRTLSAVDELKNVHALMVGGEPALPASRELAAQLFVQMEGPELDEVVQDEYAVARISARVSLSETEGLLHALPDINRKLETEYRSPELTVHKTGFTVLMGAMEEYLLASQIESFAIAGIAITLLMGLLMKSARLGALSIIPNALPVFAGLAFMAGAGLSLDPGTVMVTCRASPDLAAFWPVNPQGIARPQGPPGRGSSAS